MGDRKGISGQSFESLRSETEFVYWVLAHDSGFQSPFITLFPLGKCTPFQTTGLESNLKSSKTSVSWSLAVLNQEHFYLKSSFTSTEKLSQPS